MDFKFVDWCYIIEISFQLAGSLLLIVNFFEDIEKKVMSNYLISQDVFVEGGKITLTKEDLQKYAKPIYMNRISFLYIIVGYIVGIFGEISTENKICMGVTIVVMMLVLIKSGLKGSDVCARHRFQEDVVKEYKASMGIDVDFIEL
ncbi:hypothetical protein [Frisingicoccus sp.]|uniref:hypothetical protein n=1 Tax=Frisingicoccus sp. TaxID=1918627 RepID=UPI003AB545EB